MTSLERCLTVLNGGIPDRVPVVPQTFLFSLESCGVRIKDVVRNPEKMAEVLARCQAQYGYDGCVIDFDDATMAEALGAKVTFRDDDPAIVDEEDVVLKDLRDIDKLKLPDPWSTARLPIWLETTRQLVKKIGDHGACRSRPIQCRLPAPGHAAIHDGFDGRGQSRVDSSPD